MAIGKSDVDLNLNKLSIRFGSIKIIEKGQLVSFYNEEEVSEYMKNENVEISVDLSAGRKSFVAYTMDLTKKYIEINTNYRT